MLKDFTVIEITKLVGPLTVVIEPNRLRFVKSVAEALEYSPYVRYLMDSNGQRFAVQVCKESTPKALKFSKPVAEQQGKAILFQNSDLVRIIRSMMPDWEEDQRYGVDGVYSKEDKAIIYDLKNAEKYQRRYNVYEKEE